MTILLVEDEAELAQLLVEQMRQAGLVVDRIGALEDALELVRQFPYDLVLLDRPCRMATGFPSFRRSDDGGRAFG